MKMTRKLGFVTFLTFIRFPLVLLFFAGAIIHAHNGPAWVFHASFWVLILAAFTDLLDGWFARRLNVETALGAHADPLMDKFFYLATLPLLVFLAMMNGHIGHATFILVLTLMFLVRDQWVTFLRSIGSLYNISGGANWTGKLRTAINFPLICAIYYYEEGPGRIVSTQTLYFFEILALGVNFLSAYVYSRRYWPYLRQSARLQPSAPPPDTRDDQTQGTVADQNNKLDSLRTMAMGVSHDFNNLLSAILGNANLMLKKLTTDSPVRENADQIRISAVRGLEISNQMLTYTGKARLDENEVDLSRVVKSAREDIERIAKDDISVTYDLSSGLPHIIGDAAQIQQAVLNLAKNSIDVMCDTAGTLTVSTGTMHCDRAYLDGAYLNQELKEGQYVYVEVADTGSGMPPEVQSRIFDPFFTTRIRGQGLGLSVVLGIMKAHNGGLRVESEREKGSKFRLLFPCVIEIAAVSGSPGDS